MKKFDFKLQPVLKYREHLENLAKQEYVQAFMDVKAAEDAIEFMQRSFELMAKNIEDETQKGIPAQLFRQYNDYLDSLENDIALKRKEHEQLQKILAVKQQSLTKKSVDKKVLERLKEKKKVQYVEEFIAEEQNRADDMTSLKKAREASENGS
ncbi:MAG: flagellar export protein FliJ [Desulfamplus sp.]|nr:flagellar export protein FliJ [Desulfamplus sp.]MBF0241800.1 flagellar export protein FliJ [Desulfamplus sp.]